MLEQNSTKLVSIFNFTFRESKQLISTIDLIAKKKNIYRAPVGVLAWCNEQVVEWLQENNLSHLIPVCKVKQVSSISKAKMSDLTFEIFRLQEKSCCISMKKI